MAGADLTAVRDALHEHFTGKTLVDIFFTADKEIAPIMAAMDAQADTGEGFGRKLITPIVFGTGTSVGADLAKVQAKAASATVGASGLYGRWEQDPVTVSATAQWSRDAMDAAIGKSTVETFKVMSKEMDLKIVATRNMWARLASGDGTGALGIIAAAGAGGSAAANWIRVGTDCINRFSRGMDLSVAATGGTGACRVTTGGTGQDHLGVLGTLPDGTVYLDGNPVSSASSRDPWVVGDVVFNYNNRAAGALTYVLPQGLLERLQERVLWLKVLKNMASVKASALFCSDNDYTAFVAGKDKSKIVEIALGQYNIGFKGMTINSLAGDVPVIADSTLPDGEFYAGPWKDAELRPRLVYTGDLVQIDNRDGLDFRLVPGTAAYQMQLYSRGNIAFPAPGKFVRGYGLSIS
jgi:hypothetical protein